MLIQTAGLKGILDLQDLVLIDSRSFGEYAKGHIPGSVNLDLFAFHWIDTTREGIRAFNEQARQILSFCGAAGDRKVVFYDNKSGMLASRGVWLLTYFSHRDVHLLDGGFEKWQKENLPTETKPNRFRPSEFSGKTDPGVMAGFEFVRDGLGRLNILDVRSPGEYDGRIIRAAKAGHIPGAQNIDWNLNLAGDGTIKDSGQLEELYPFSKDAEIVAYCQGGYRAANTFVALKKIGFRNVRVYLGSWGEWANRPELPVESN